MSRIDPAAPAPKPRRVPRERPLYLLLLLLCVIAALPSVFATIVATERYSAEAQALRQEAADKVALLRIDTEKELDAAIDLLRVLMQSTMLRKGDLEAFHTETVAVAPLRGRNIILREADGTQLINSLRPYGTPLPNTVGAQHYSALKSGMPVVTPLIPAQRARVVQRPLVAVVVPIPEQQRVLSLGIELDQLYGVIVRRPLRDDQIAVVADANGAILARSLRHDESVGRQLPDKFLAAVNAKVAAGNSRGIWEGRNFEGVPIYTAFEVSEKSGWIFSLGLTQQALYEPLRRLQAVLVTLVALMLFGTGGALLYVWRLLAGSMYALHHQAAEGAQGKRSNPLHTPVREVNAVSRRLVETMDAKVLLIMELAHRAKNTLASLYAMAQISGRGSANHETFIADFGARIQGLSTAHDLLYQEGGEGAGMRELLMRELMLFSQPHTLKAQGPDVWLSYEEVLAFAMVFHELATNSAKYGAFSREDGLVQVTWTMDDGRLRLVWQERGGPIIDSPPTRSGFGSVVLGAKIRTELRGTVECEYPPQGLVCTIDIPHTPKQKNLPP